MAINKNQDLDAILEALKKLEADINYLKERQPSSDLEGAVKIKPAADGVNLEYNSTFSAGELNLNFDALVHAKTGVMITNSETMTHNAYGKLFSRNVNFAPQQVIMGYEFGDAVKGVNKLTLIGESTRLNHYVHGWADGQELTPLRFDKTGGCSCGDDKPNNFVLVNKGGGKTKPLAIEFPEDYVENLSLLIPVIESAIKNERYTLKSINLCAAAGCFWANVACEVAAKACIVGCGASGPLVPACIALCLAAEIACLLAVKESKEPATLTLV